MSARKTDPQQVLALALSLVASGSAPERLRLCALISYRLSCITARDRRLAKVGKTPQKEKR